VMSLSFYGKNINRLDSNAYAVRPLQ